MCYSGNNECILTNYISEINEKINDLCTKHEEKFNDEILIAYRGESRDHGETKLMPSIFRKIEDIDKEPHLFELMSDYSIVPKDASCIDKLIEAQHYIAMSRILDISFNVLVALFFACESNIDDDANLYIFGFPKKYSPSSNYISDYYSDSLKNNYHPYSKNFKVISHSLSNDRIKAQSGGFIFFPGKDFYPIDECYYRIIKISCNDKKRIIEELEMFFNVNKYKIYPEKENIIEKVKNLYKKDSYEAYELTYETEINSYFEKLKYELKLSVKSNTDILRYLRKEELDLITYIKSNFEKKVENDSITNTKCNSKEKDCSECIEQVKKRFDYIRLKYKEI